MQPYAFIHRFLALFVLCAAALDAQELRGDANMAYIYPAGGKAGTTFRVWVGGSRGVKDASGLYFKDGVAQATLVGVEVPSDKGALTRFRKGMEEKALKDNPNLDLQQLRAHVDAIYKEHPEYVVERKRLNDSYQLREISSDALAAIATFEVTIKPDA